jgi:hypothetical protein
MEYADTDKDPTDSIDAKANESLLLEWVHDRDVACPLCNYNLRGLTVPRCPECGNLLRLSVALAGADVKAWLAMATVVCGSAGMGVLFLCIVMRAGLPHHGLDWAIIFFMAMIPSPLVLLKFRRRFLRMSRGSQWLTMGLVSALPAVAMAVLCASLR